MRLLFVCGRNRRRSPTAEEVFGAVPGVEVCSAGVSPEADNPLTDDLIEWAENHLRYGSEAANQAIAMFSARLKGKRVVCLGIPDNYEYMDSKLVHLLWDRVPARSQAWRPRGAIPSDLSIRRILDARLIGFR